MISFEEQVAAIRQHLSSIYEREENWRKAANVLVGIPLETGQKYDAFIRTVFLIGAHYPPLLFHFQAIYGQL